MIEKYLINHCAPTLASLKSANLFAIYYSSGKELEEQIDYWNRELEEKGISILVMKKKPGWALVYVCRKYHLQKRLRTREVAEFLSEYGYQKMDVMYALEKLKERLNENSEFPHEIGIFLDYPLEDVKGFIQNAGRNFKCKGCWKVYCNECETMKLFAKYDKCKEVYKRLWSAGRSLQRLTVTA